MDAETAEGRHEQLLDKFEREQIPILLGTQMVAKGLDFPQVTLVGVLAADLSLYVDNYRAAERTFSLLTQVVGRAGRGGSAGRAVIQTYTPESDVIQCAARQVPRRAPSSGPPSQCGKSCAASAPCRSWRPENRRCWVPPLRR